MSEYTEEQIERAARAAHELNRTYSREVMGDNTHLPWRDAPRHLQDSARAGVRAIIANPSLSSVDMHACRMRYKTVDGWVYGEKKDLIARTHPCMVPFDELPLCERTKDTLFSETVRTVLDMEHTVSVHVCEPREYRGQRGQS